MALLWKDAPENPNRGKDAKTHKPKEPLVHLTLSSKAAAKKDKPKKKKKAAETEEEEEEEAEAEGEGEAPSSEQDDAPSSDD
jgi:hypothetical protein